MTERTDTREAGMVERRKDKINASLCGDICDRRKTDHDYTQTACSAAPKRPSDECSPTEWIFRLEQYGEEMRDYGEKLRTAHAALREENERLRADLDTAMRALREVNESGFYGQWLKKHTAILSKARRT